MAHASYPKNRTIVEIRRPAWKKLPKKAGAAAEDEVAETTDARKQ